MFKRILLAFLTLSVTSYAVPLLVEALQQSEARNQEPSVSLWKEIRRGTMLDDIAFDVDGKLWLRTRTRSVLLHPGWDSDHEELESVLVSEPSHTGRYQLFIGDIYDLEPAYLLDRHEAVITHLPFYRYVHGTYSWSPDDSFLIVSRDYEATGQLFVINLSDRSIREVCPKTLSSFDAESWCGLKDWGGEMEAGYLADDYIHWIGKARFQFKLSIICNPYDEDCDYPESRKKHGVGEKIYRITVDVGSDQVFEELLTTAPSE